MGRALKSVEQQTYHPSEIIIVDDGSTDGTQRFIKDKFPAVNYIKQPNSGVSSARNRGINSARANWIALLDSDDKWKPHKLEAQKKALEQNAARKICHTNEIWIKNGQQINQQKKHRKMGGWIYRRCLPMCRISPSSILIHRSVFDKVGFFDESLPACEDYDLWLRICSQFPVQFVDEPLILKHGGHDDQLSQKYWGMDRFRIRALEKMIQNVSLPPDDFRATLKTLLEKLKIYRIGARKRDKQEELKILNDKIEKYQKMI